MTWAFCRIRRSPPGIPIWIVADRNENGFKRVARLGDGWVTLAPTLERFTTARHRIDHYAADYGRADRCRTSALYVAFNLQTQRRARPRGRMVLDGVVFRTVEGKARAFFYHLRHTGRMRAHVERLCRGGIDDDHRAHRVGRPTRAIAHSVERDQTTIAVARRSRKNSPQKRKGTQGRR